MQSILFIEVVCVLCIYKLSVSARLWTENLVSRWCM